MNKQEKGYSHLQSIYGGIPNNQKKVSLEPVNKAKAIQNKPKQQNSLINFAKKQLKLDKEGWQKGINQWKSIGDWAWQNKDKIAKAAQFISAVSGAKK
jgi:hypothetical protein